MSVAFAPRGNRPPLSPAQIQKMLDENAHLIQTIQEYQAKGQLMECHQYQQVLHRNLVYLASVADANQNIQALLPVNNYLYLTFYFVYHLSLITCYTNEMSRSTTWMNLRLFYFKKQFLLKIP